MGYKVVYKKKIEKRLAELPLSIKQLFFRLLIDIQTHEAIRPEWRNFSKLGKNRYHCNLTYSYVACWELKKDRITIEVYYVGSREKAPY